LKARRRTAAEGDRREDIDMTRTDMNPARAAALRAPDSRGGSFRRAVALAATLLACSAALAQGATDNRPLVGAWTWAVPINGCVERYVYRADGTSETTSRNETTKGTYRLGAQPAANGRYRLERVTTADNRGVDCADADSDETGLSHVVYVEFDDKRQRHWVCADERSDRCLGPLNKSE
jgi:hypothetical protein